MERRGAWLLVGAVAAIAVASALVSVLAFDDEESVQRQAEPVAPAPAQPLQRAERLQQAAAELEEAGVRGTLVYSGPDCRLHALPLPSLKPARTPTATSCVVRLPPAGRRYLPGAVWQPQGKLAARCDSGRVRLFRATGRPLRRTLVGCAPAWSPDGSLTFVRRGEVVRYGRKKGLRVVLSRRDLLGAVRRHPSIAGSPRRLRALGAREIAWLDKERVAVILRARVAAAKKPLELIAVYRGRRLTATEFSFGSRLHGLRASPRGNYLAALSNRPGGFLVLDRKARFVRLPITPSGFRAVAWSPDETWTAIAGRSSVYVFPTDDLSPRLIVLPVVARDLAWR